MFPVIVTAALAAVSPATPAATQAPPTLEIVWPSPGARIELGADSDRAIGIVVRSDFRLAAAGSCGTDRACGHVHMKIDPSGNSCNLPGKPYNSMNSDFGGSLIKASFGACPDPFGTHLIGVLLADDRHQPVLVNGKPVTAVVTVTTTATAGGK